MAYFYLKENSSTEILSLDEEAVSFGLGDVERQYDSIQLFSDQAHITGEGSISPGLISISRDFRKEGYNIAWNVIRNTILKWIGMSKSKQIYFYIVDDSSVTRKTRVFPVSKSGENYTKIFKTDQVSMVFQMTDGYFQKTTSETDTYSVTTTGAESNTVTNNGNVKTPPLFTFTPSADFSLLQIQLNQNYGFRLQGSFQSGEVITYDCATGVMTIDGNEATGYLTAGSIFKLEPGDNILTVYACPGSLVTTFYERVI